MDYPEQPKSPFETACAFYCWLRHRDHGTADLRCERRGECFSCAETVSGILRTYNREALTQ